MKLSINYGIIIEQEWIACSNKLSLIWLHSSNFFAHFHLCLLANFLYLLIEYHQFEIGVHLRIRNEFNARMCERQRSLRCKPLKGLFSGEGGS